MRARVWQFATVAYLVLCLLLGGASAAGAAANAALQVLGLGLILAVLWQRDRAPLPPESRFLLWVIAAFALIVLLSLIPLPASLWQGLPMRGEIARGFGMLGIEGASIPLSLAPNSTAASFLWLLPPAALFVLVAQLPPETRRNLPGAVLVVALLSIALGVFQLMGGTHSPLRFYEITNTGSAVGFFANRNHQATFLLCALPLTAFFAARLVSKRSGRTKRSGGAIISIAAAIFITLGIALIGSEAGYGLFLPVAFASALIYRRAAQGRIGGKWVIALSVLSVLFLVLALAGPLSRESLAGKFTDNPTSRRAIAANTREAIADTFPVGTGLGTFANIYRRYEDQNRVGREYVNHAHNDYLEVALELGLPGILLILAFMLWWLRRSLYVWRNEFSGAGLARAGSVMIGTVLLHSLVDYPIRTSAIAAIFAMGCAFLIPYAAPRKQSPQRQNAEGQPLRHIEVV